MPAAQILVVEDEGVVAAHIRARLQRLGYGVAAVAATAEAALRHIGGQPPDLVLMDIRLPGPKDGVAAAAEIRERYHIPVVYLTAYADDETVQRAKVTQPYGYILKPFVVRELYSAIEIALHRHTMERRASEQRRIEWQRRTRASLTSLAGGIAHDFNNLLTVILGSASLALLDYEDPSPTRDSLLAIQAAASRGAELTAQMLTYSGRGPLLMEPVDLNGLAAEASAARDTLVPPTITLRLHLDPRAPQVRGSAAQLRRLLGHLLRNAVEAIGAAAGSITVATALRQAERADLDTLFLAPDLPPGPYLALEVHDTGAGMDQEARERAFEPFFSTKFAGRGMSLAEVLGIVSAHRGGVRLESAPGAGTVVTVLLPAAPAA